ncbi:hypothetical protein Tco_0851996 [Tanacetum coccineum]
MAEPNNYITATRKNFISNDNEEEWVEKCIVEIQGTFLEKIRNDAFNGNEGENAYEHINKFLDVVRPIKINGLTQDRFRLNIFLVSLTGAAYECFTKERMGSIATWDNMVEKWYDELADGKLKDETLALKSKIEGSWGDATPGVNKICRWVKEAVLENFHELEYEVLSYDDYGLGRHWKNDEDYC